jgi:hypothetical protein
VRNDAIQKSAGWQNKHAASRSVGTVCRVCTAISRADRRILLDTGNQILLRLNDSELTDLLTICVDALNKDGLGAGKTVASRIACNKKFRKVLTKLGATDPACPRQHHLTWGIAILLDGMERAA